VVGWTRQPILYDRAHCGSISQFVASNLIARKELPSSLLSCSYSRLVLRHVIISILSCRVALCRAMPCSVVPRRVLSHRIASHRVAACRMASRCAALRRISPRGAQSSYVMCCSVMLCKVRRSIKFWCTPLFAFFQVRGQRVGRWAPTRPRTPCES
jgi:hypothetical protein